mmetsp:Transcript_59158/g.175832  ORF Transcript_59158/g.175832 Transcript_59158/m.175832 type:complete len:218 (-) Transcript_59158:345-998(-)
MGCRGHTLVIKMGTKEVQFALLSSVEKQQRALEQDQFRHCRRQQYGAQCLEPGHTPFQSEAHPSGNRPTEQLRRDHCQHLPTPAQTPNKLIHQDEPRSESYQMILHPALLSPRQQGPSQQLSRSLFRVPPHPVSLAFLTTSPGRRTAGISTAPRDTLARTLDCAWPPQQWRNPYSRHTQALRSVDAALKSPPPLSMLPASFSTTSSSDERDALRTGS